MPPKTIQKKHKKPLTPLQRKLKKRKQELIHKAQVKSQYYKQLNKDKDDDAPDYVKEIFGAERTIDENGNVVELAPDSMNNSDTEEQEVERVYDLNQSSSSEDDEDDHESGSKKLKTAHKPNPFKSQLEERERRKRETEQEREERLKKLEEAKKARQEYFKHRREQRGKMLAKSKRGQPNMAAQMDILLEKIEQKGL